MTIKENLDKVIKEFNAGYGGNTNSKPTPPSKPSKPDKPSKPVSQEGQRVLRRRK